MRHSSPLFLLALWAGFSCSGMVTSQDPSAGDASTATDASQPDTSTHPESSTTTDGAQPDAQQTEFCAGSNKASMNGASVEPALVTSSLIVMDCCDGFVVRFHTQAQLGIDVSVMVQSFGLLPSGDYTLPTDAGGMQVEVTGSNLPPGPSATGQGTMHLQVPPSYYDDPTRVSFCLGVNAPGNPLDGVNLWASEISVVPWGWQDRFEVRLLADPTMNASEASKVPLGELPLASGAPLLHLLSLAWYDGTTHAGYWDTWYSGDWILSQLPDVGVYGVPFVVLANGERVYQGAFMTAASSVAVDMPVIVLEDMQTESFRIDWGYPGQPASPDPRSDPRILSVLAESSKLVP